jgi:hypothetical protein
MGWMFLVVNISISLFLLELETRVKFPDPCHNSLRDSGQNKGKEEPTVFVCLVYKENNRLLETMVKNWRKQSKTMQL